ncbi:MAG: UDP-N-acetylmuramoyl-L-alanyl-D-glutamate--2,6-diaminopimelate ligase [Elusimicrobia bacterium]|nr:UDP-N-acetylmuramoyl-L-alanyl-D-glutamate--2,6-diaminopimelate ligase [Elusimicrobiota bacterium]
MELKAILQGVAGARCCGDAGIDVTGLAHDSRTVPAGGLFIALPGARTDGNRHIRDALERGAAALMSELSAPPPPMAAAATWVQVPDVFSAMGRAADNYFGSPTASLAVIGVTGTTGKTTTTYFLESIISRCGGAPGVIGTIGHRLRHRTIEKAANTTPYSLDLMRLLARMREGGATHVAMEVSSHALATKRVEEVEFDAAVLTNLQRDHLDFHKTMDSYFEAKARIFELLTRASSSKSRRLAVLNRDDASFARFARAAAQAQALSYGFAPEADFRAEGLALGRQGTSFRLRRGGREWAVRLGLLGRHNAHNALAAAAAAWSLGLAPEGILEGLASLDRVPGRLEPVDAGQGFSVLVDYAHTDHALASVLETIRSLPHRRILAVFGCGGDRDAGKRGPMGAAACAGSDLAILTSDNPRTEDPAAIIAQIEEGIRRSGRQNYKIVPDRREAIYEALRQAQPEDAVLIAGKGHEDAQILRDRTIHFDDREVAREALKDLGKI